MSAHGPDCPCTKCTGFRQGHTVTLKHGAYATVAISLRAEQLAALIRETAPVYEPCDESAVRALAIILARVERAECALAKAEDELDADDDPAGLLAQSVDEFARLRSDLRQWLLAAEKYFAAMGMTPGSRARLGLDIARARRLTVVDLHEQAAQEADMAEVELAEGEAG